jgi:phosphoribosylaminoimidazole-succinocarboxamide synthase
VLRRWVAARCDPYRDEIPPIPPQVIGETAAVYIDAYERITGETFAVPPPGRPVLDRIRDNLKRYF